jgi:hypothetical protein
MPHSGSQRSSQHQTLHTESSDIKTIFNTFAESLDTYSFVNERNEISSPNADDKWIIQPSLIQSHFIKNHPDLDFNKRKSNIDFFNKFLKEEKNKLDVSIRNYEELKDKLLDEQLKHTVGKTAKEKAEDYNKAHPEKIKELEETLENIKSQLKELFAEYVDESSTAGGKKLRKANKRSSTNKRKRSTNKRSTNKRKRSNKKRSTRR